MFTHSPRAVRRHALSTSCLLALPTAFALTAPAPAQTIISSNLSTVNLSSYGAGGVSIASGVSITSTGMAAVSATAAAARLGNAGHVADMSGSGIDLGAGGSVSNSGSVNAADYGVRVNGAAGVVSNSGAIAAGYDGVSLNKGGTVSNTGSIFGAHMGVYTGNAQGSVSNSGTISARSGDAVSLYSGGSLTNTASGDLSGGYTGVYAGGDAQITNAGLITGPQFGAYLMGASTITNSGTMAGGVDGVMDLNAGGVIANTGLIHGGQIGVRLAGNGAVDNSGVISGGTTGVKLGANSMLANEASGHVTGGTTAVVAAAGDVLRNAGQISGQSGIIANGAVSIVNTGTISATQPGGNAISLSSGASTITLGTGSDIIGNIAANNTASQINLTGSGTLDTSITGFATGSALTVQQNAVWVGEGNWQVAQLINNGVFTPGVMGTPLSLTGNFTQSATGTLRVLVTPTGISPFAITGTATLGGTLRYVLAPGTYAPSHNVFLTATGGISGSFASITTSQTGLQATPLDFTKGTVIAVSGSGSSTQVESSVLNITSPLTVSPSGTPLFADTTQAMVLGAFATGATVIDRANNDAPAGGWAQATASSASASGAYSVQGGGFLAGIDHGNGFGGRIGFAIGYDSSNMRDKSSGTAGLKTVRLGLYAAQPLGRFLLSADIMDGIISRNTTRTTGADAATAKGNANVISGDVQLAMPLVWEGASIVPAFGLRIASVTAGRLDETSATQAYALDVAGASGTTIAPYLRMTVQKTYLTTSNLAITPDVSLGVTTMLNNPGATTRLTAQDGTAFFSHPEHMAPVSGQFSAGVSVSRGAWSLTARYTGEAGGNWSGQSLQAGVQVRF